MAVQGTLGTSCILSIDGTGTVMPAVLNSCSPDMNLQLRAVTAAMGRQNALIGYAPSASAKCGFSVTCKIPYNNGFNQVRRAMQGGYFDSAGVHDDGTQGNPVPAIQVTMTFGTIGKISIQGCICFTADIRGSEGQDITAQMTFESDQFPDDPSNTPILAKMEAAPPVWAFSDVTGYNMLSGDYYTMVNSFSFRVQRTQAKYVGNSTTGMAQQIGVGYQEVLIDAEYLKLTDNEIKHFRGSTGVGDQVASPLIISGSRVTAGGQVFGLSAPACIYEQMPKNAGSETEWVRETTTGIRCMTGEYLIVSQ